MRPKAEQCLITERQWCLKGHPHILLLDRALRLIQQNICQRLIDVGRSRLRLVVRSRREVYSVIRGTARLAVALRRTGGPATFCRGRNIRELMRHETVTLLGWRHLLRIIRDHDRARGIRPAVKLRGLAYISMHSPT